MISALEGVWLTTDTIGRILVLILTVAELTGLFYKLVEASLGISLVFVLILILVIEDRIRFVIHASYKGIARHISHLD